MSDEVTVTETALVLQEIDESDVLVKESVLAYLMGTVKGVLNSAYPEEPEFRAEIIDEFAELAVDTIRSEEDKIGDAIKEAIRISKRVLLKSMRLKEMTTMTPRHTPCISMWESSLCGALCQSHYKATQTSTTLT